MQTDSAKKTIPLADLRVGQSARVREILVENTVNQRLMAFGLMPGELVRVVHVAPFGDPISIEFCSQKLMIRREDAQLVDVEIGVE